jgi:iron complex outermembrane recepter protein
VSFRAAGLRFQQVIAHIGSGPVHVRPNALEHSRPQDEVVADVMAEMPALHGRSSLRYGTRLWFAEAEGIAVNAQRRVNPELLETPTPGYAAVNVKAGCHVRQMTVTIGVDNALDRFYYESLSYQRDPFRNGARVPEPGQTVFVSVSYQLSNP